VDLPGSQGPHRLIQEGAKLVHEVEDVLEELPLPGGILNVRSPARPVQDLSLEEEKLFALLTDQPVLVDDLTTQSGLQPSETLALLFSLEMKGFVQQLSGKRFTRKSLAT